LTGYGAAGTFLEEGTMTLNFVRHAALALSVAALLVVGYAGAAPAFAHVHAVTPLNVCSVDNAEHSGGRIILDTPAAVENGGPIQVGPIPLNTGNAAFDPVTGAGNHADPQCP
jgi:hypothetical protein